MLTTSTTPAGTTYTITPVGASDSNYKITYVDATGTIVPATPQVSVTDAGDVYNDRMFAVTAATVTGVPVDGTIASLTNDARTLSISYYTVGANNSLTPLTTGAPVSAGSYEAVVSYTTDNSNYTNASGSVCFTITPANATVAYSGYTGDTYDGGQHTQTVTVTGVGNDGTLYTTNLSGTNAASYSQAWSFSNANYNSIGESGTLAFTIGQAALTVTPNAASTTFSDVALNNTTYSDNTSDYAITGFQNGQTISTAGVTLSGSLAFNGSTSTSVLNAGTYTQAVGTLALSSTNSNYSMTFSNPTPNSYVITAAPLTVTPNAVSATYSGVALNNTTYSDNTGNYSITGFVNSETINSAGVTLTGSLAFNGSTSTSVLSAGPYTQAVGTLALSSTNSNYAMTFSNPTPNKYIITAAPLTVTASAESKTYGQTVTFGSGSTLFTSSGLQNGETIGSVTLAVSNSGGAATAAVGSYTITPSAATGGTFTAGNYTITYATGTLTVTTAANSIYVLDGTAAGALTLSGNASINTTTGNVVVDSSSASAISASGNAQVTAVSVQVVGSVSKSGNAKVTKTGTPSATGDPLANLGLAVPAIPTGAAYNTAVAENLSGNSTATISQGYYSTINVSGNAKLTLNAGVYVIGTGGVIVSGNGVLNVSGVTFIIKGGGFTVSGNAGVSGTNVFIFNAGSSYNGTTDGGTYGAITLSGNGTLSLSPPTTGTYAGILIFQTRDNTKALTFSGNAMAGITGTIYAPAAQLAESGNAQLNATADRRYPDDQRQRCRQRPDAGCTRRARSLTPRPRSGPPTASTTSPGRHRPDHRHRRRLRRPEHLPGPRRVRHPVRPDHLRTDALRPVRAGVVVPDGAQSERPGRRRCPRPTRAARHRQLGSRGSARRRMGPCHRPGRQIILVEANSQSLSDLMAGVATAASQPGVSVVSMSWGFAEGQAVFAGDEATYDSVFTRRRA